MTTNVVYPTDGTNDLFAVPFPYLEKSHVHVFLDGVELPTTAYTWETSGSIRLTSVPPAGSKVGLYRQTPNDALTEYQAGATVTTEELETDSLQALYLIEELANGTIGGTYDEAGTFVWDARGNRIINVGDPVGEADAVNLRHLLQALGDFVSLGLNTSPKFWEFDGDGTETKFYLPGADVADPLFYDVFVAGSGIEPTDGFSIHVSPDPSGSYVEFTEAPAAGAQGWVILRGYAKPVGDDLMLNPTFIEWLKQLIKNTLYETTNVLELGPLSFLIPLYDVTGTAETVDGSKKGYLLRTTNAAPVNLTIRGNTGSGSEDWDANPVAAPFFSVKQGGAGQVTISGEAGVTIKCPVGYLPMTRGVNSVITATADYIAGGVWTLSGDLALDPAVFAYGGPVETVSVDDSGMLVLDLSVASNFKTTLGADATLEVINLKGTGYVTEFELEIAQDATGGRALSLPTGFRALGGSDTAVASAANAVTVLSAKTFDNGGTWRFAMQESS